MSLIVFALRRPITILVMLAALPLVCLLALQRMAVDVFPSLNLPVIYVC